MTDASWIGYASLAVVVVLLLVRLPIGAVLGGTAFCGMWLVAGPHVAWGMLSRIPYEFSAHWTLSTIPMFLLMGYVAFYSRITEAMFRTAQLWLGRLPGGLGIASVAGSAGFAAATGSSLASAAAMGRIAVPEMTRNGYHPGFSSGIVAAAGTIGSMIPPSINMIIFGVFAEVSIGKLFIAGIIPGLLTALFYSIVILVRVKITPSLAPRSPAAIPWAVKLRALIDIWPFALLVVGVIGGLFAGIFTPTEAGAVGAALSFAIAFLKRALTWAVVKKASIETVRSTASIFFIAIGAALFTRFLALVGLPASMSEAIASAQLDTFTLLIAIAALYLFLGMFLDSLGCMLLTLPIVLPIVNHQGIDLIWFGILLVKFLEIGLITPPVGLNVFVIKEMVGKAVPLTDIFKGVSWFIVSDIVLVGVLMAWPILTLVLPQYMS